MVIISTNSYSICLLQLRVISNSIGEGVFASGNLSKNWETFERLHQCTQWCKYYQLPRDYDESDGADTNLQRKLVRDLKAPVAPVEPPSEILPVDMDEHASDQPNPSPISPRKPNAMSLSFSEALL